MAFLALTISSLLFVDMSHMMLAMALPMGEVGTGTKTSFNICQIGRTTYADPQGALNRFDAGDLPCPADQTPQTFRMLLQKCCDVYGVDQALSSTIVDTSLLPKTLTVVTSSADILVDLATPTTTLALNSPSTDSDPSLRDAFSSPRASVSLSLSSSADATPTLLSNPDTPSKKPLLAGKYVAMTYNNLLSYGKASTSSASPTPSATTSEPSAASDPDSSSASPTPVDSGSDVSEEPGASEASYPESDPSESASSDPDSDASPQSSEPDSNLYLLSLSSHYTTDDYDGDLTDLLASSATTKPSLLHSSSKSSTTALSAPAITSEGDNAHLMSLSDDHDEKADVLLALATTLGVPHVTGTAHGSVSTSSVDTSQASLSLSSTLRAAHEHLTKSLDTGSTATTASASPTVSVDDSGLSSLLISPAQSTPVLRIDFDRLSTDKPSAATPDTSSTSQPSRADASATTSCDCGIEEATSVPLK